MIKSSTALERSVDSASGDVSIIDTTRKKPAEITNTIIGGESYHVIDEPTIGTNISTLESLREEFGEVSPYTIKKINREITSKIAPSEREKILEERDGLVNKTFKVGLSAKEERRLTYIRWQLDRFDDVETGEFLDYVEEVTKSHEKLANELKGFLGQIENIRIDKPKRKKGKSGR